MGIRPFAFCVFALFLFAGQLSAQSESDGDAFAKNPAIAFIDVAGIEARSLAWQDVRRQIEDLRAQYTNEISAMESTLQQKGRALEQEQNLIAPELFQQRQDAFRLEIENLRRIADRMKENLDGLIKDARRRLRIKLFEIVDELAVQYGIDIVMDASSTNSNIVMFNNMLLLNDQVLERLNLALPALLLASPPSLPEGDETGDDDLKVDESPQTNQ